MTHASRQTAQSRHVFFALIRDLKGLALTPEH